MIADNVAAAVVGALNAAGMINGGGAGNPPWPGAYAAHAAHGAGAGAGVLVGGVAHYAGGAGGAGTFFSNCFLISCVVK